MGSPSCPPVLALVVAIALSLAACGDDASVADQRRDSAHDAAIAAGLDEEVAEFLGLAARGATAAYQATLTGIDGADEVVVTSRAPDLRIDIIVDQRTVATQIAAGATVQSCLVEDEDADTLICRQTTTPPSVPGRLDPAAMSELTEALARGLEDYTFELRTETVAGHDVTCLITTIRPGRERAELGDSGTLCASPEGVMLRVHSGDSRFEATSYTTDVPDDAFELVDQTD